MCQVDEEYPSLKENLQLPGFSKKCCKCKEGSAAVVIRAGDTYCRDCFKEYFIHKFRAMLGKNRIIYPGEKVLLAVSGGPSSCSMLRQVQEGLSQNAHKKLRFLPGIVYIDEGAVTGQTQEQRRRTRAELRALFQDTGFPFHVVPLERVLDLPGSALMAAAPAQVASAASYKSAVDQFLQAPDSNGGQTPTVQETTANIDVQESQKLQQLLDSVKTLTAQMDLLRTLRQHLLVHTARTEGYNKLMFGDSCTRLAVQLLVSISLGRGAALAQDTGFSDARYGDIISVRPMRDYSAKEIGYFNHLFSVPSVFSPSLDTLTKDKSSIQRLTESFVTKLQEDFPSTVSTIYRTSEKLQTACGGSSSADPCDLCLLCLCSLDTSVENASAFQATMISEQLSKTRISSSSSASCSGPALTAGRCCAETGPGVCKESEGGDCCSSTQPVERTDVSHLLCYSCQLTVKDLTSVERLPQYILTEAQRRQRRSEMREQISDFLLTEED